MATKKAAPAKKTGAKVRKPKIGDPAWYIHHDMSDGHRNGTDRSPAIITNVFENLAVNLTVFFDGQGPEPRGSVSHKSIASGDDKRSWDYRA